MRRAFDMYQTIDGGERLDADDESGLRRVRRDRRCPPHLGKVEIAYRGRVAHGSFTRAPAPSRDAGSSVQLLSCDPARPLSFAEDGSVVVLEEPVEFRVFVDEPPAAHARGLIAPEHPVRGSRDAKTHRTLRRTVATRKRIVLESLATLAGVVLVAFVCASVFHFGLSRILDVTRAKTPKLSTAMVP